MIGRASDQAILGAAADAVRAWLDDDASADGSGRDAHARLARVQVHGLLQYAASRGDDPTAERTQELADALTALAGNPLVTAAPDGDPYAAAGAALAAAADRDDDAAREVQQVLRPLLVRHLDDELASTTPLIDAFRGVVRRG